MLGQKKNPQPLTGSAQELGIPTTGTWQEDRLESFSQNQDMRHAPKGSFCIYLGHLLHTLKVPLATGLPAQ